MKKILQNNKKTAKYLSKLPKYYALTIWADYAIVEVPFSGKCNKKGEPLVWIYHDMNGFYDEYYLGLISDITSAPVFCWSDNKATIEHIRKNLKREWRDK